MVLVLEPRRVAARAAARRMAAEHGTPLGEVFGYQVRFDREAGPRGVDADDACEHRADQRADGDGHPRAVHPVEGGGRVGAGGLQS